MPSSKNASFFRANGLSLVVGALFLLSWAGQFIVGRSAWNGDLLQKGAPPVGWVEYATSGHFIGATFENWESEFLQMGFYVLLTVWLRQRGSAESRPLDPQEENPRIDAGPKPWPLRSGARWRVLYANSLSIALFALLALSFALHLLGSWHHELDELRLAHRSPVGLIEHACGAQFWFESLQNWQSEFLSVLAIVLLSIVLRQDQSPESKPLEAPHSQTGD